LFRQLPQVDSGFECGVLLGDSPRAFPDLQPFAKNILAGWKLNQQELEASCDTDDFDQFYRNLSAKCHCLKPGTTDIFDKTPRYLAKLDECLEKAKVPFIVTYKDPRALVYSDFTRSKQPDFDAWFETYAGAKLAYMRSLYANFEKIPDLEGSVLTMSLERLCMESRASCEALFSHCGYTFDLEYFLLKNLRFHHTRSDSVSGRIPFEYREGFSKKQQARIADRFKEFTQWFYD
jgi:hypothetical protein